MSALKSYKSIVRYSNGEKINEIRNYNFCTSRKILQAIFDISLKENFQRLAQKYKITQSRTLLSFLSHPVNPKHLRAKYLQKPEFFNQEE